MTVQIILIKISGKIFKLLFKDTHRSILKRLQFQILHTSTVTTKGLIELPDYTTGNV